MARLGGYAYIALGAIACALSIGFTVSCWDYPWPFPQLEIDCYAYLSGAAGATWGTLLRLHQLFSSPGYQLYLRFLFASLAPETALHTSKVLSLSMFFVSALLLYELGRRWFDPAVGQVAALLFLFSESWKYYCNLIQYEVLAGFLMLLLLTMLMARESERSSAIAQCYEVAIGGILAFLSMIQSRYLLLLILPMTHSWLMHRQRFSLRDLRRNGVILTVWCLLIAAWILVQSTDQGKMVLLQAGGNFRMRVGNNPNAMGYSFPLPAVVEPSGWRFVYSMPTRWLWLIAQRALYLFGVKRDVWTLPPVGFRSGPIGSHSWWNLAAAMTFATGLVLASIRPRRGEQRPEFALGVVLLGCVILPPLLLFGSERFIVPVVPLMALFQAYAMMSCMRPFLGTRWIRLPAHPASTFALAAVLGVALSAAIHLLHVSLPIQTGAPDIKTVMHRISVQSDLAHHGAADN